MDIVEKSNMVLQRIENNDPGLTCLDIVNRDFTTDNFNYTEVECFWLHNGADLSRLGNAIGNNEHLSLISFHKSSEWTLDTAPLFEGLQRNTTIKNLSLHDSIGIGVLNEYVANISSLTRIGIIECDLRGGVAESIAPAMHMFPNLNIIAINLCKIDDASLKEFATGIRGISSLQELYLLSIDDDTTDDYTGTKIVSSLIGNAKLEYLDLSSNSIGRSGCESIVTLLEDLSCNITELTLGSCGLQNDLTTTIVSSLVGNTKLEKLDLSSSRIGGSDLFDNIIRKSCCESIATLLQDTNSNISRINLARTKIDDECATLLARSLVGNIKLECLDLSGNPDITIGSGWNAFICIFLNYSNTTLCSLGKEDSGEDFVPDCLATLLKLNLAVNTEPLFELDAEDDERKPKALPYVIDWFGRRARETTRNRLVPKSIKTRKLSSIFQFARAMPLKFVPSPSDMLLLHEEARDQLKKESRKMERRIATIQKFKKDLDDEIKAKDETIKHLHSLTKRRKHGV